MGRFVQGFSLAQGTTAGTGKIDRVTCMTRSWAQGSLCVQFDPEREKNTQAFSELYGLGTRLLGQYGCHWSASAGVRGTWQMSAWAPS
jgi:hypothetical protein